MKNANLTNRTNLRLHLQRQQAQNEEKREQLQYSQSLKNTYKSNVIDMPPAPVQKSEVPPQILQVSMTYSDKYGHPSTSTEFTRVSLHPSRLIILQQPSLHSHPHLPALPCTPLFPIHTEIRDITSKCDVPLKSSIITVPWTHRIALTALPIRVKNSRQQNFYLHHCRVSKKLMRIQRLMGKWCTHAVRGFNEHTLRPSERGLHCFWFKGSQKGGS